MLNWLTVLTCSNWQCFVFHTFRKQTARPEECVVSILMNPQQGNFLPNFLHTRPCPNAGLQSVSRSSEMMKFKPQTMIINLVRFISNFLVSGTICPRFVVRLGNSYSGQYHGFPTVCCRSDKSANDRVAAGENKSTTCGDPQSVHLCYGEQRSIQQWGIYGDDLPYEPRRRLPL